MFMIGEMFMGGALASAVSILAWNDPSQNMQKDVKMSALGTEWTVSLGLALCLKSARSGLS